MSIRCMTYIWEHSQTKEGLLLLLLAIADYAHDDGSNAFPSLTTLAKKTRMTRTHVIRLVKQAEKLGELKVKRGHGKGHPNRYTIVMANGNIITPFAKPNGHIGAPNGHTPRYSNHYIDPLDSTVPGGKSAMTENQGVWIGDEEREQGYVFCGWCGERHNLGDIKANRTPCGAEVVWKGKPAIPDTPGVGLLKAARWSISPVWEWDGFQTQKEMKQWLEFETLYPLDAIKSSIAFFCTTRTPPAKLAHNVMVAVPKRSQVKAKPKAQRKVATLEDIKRNREDDK